MSTTGHPHKRPFGVVRDLIAQDQVVIFAFYVPGWLKDNAQGSFSMIGLNPLGVDPRELVMSTRSQGMNSHSIKIVDHLDNAEGETEWILLQNSWGDTAGDGGLYHMHFDTFLAVFIDILLPQDFEDRW